MANLQISSVDTPSTSGHYTGCYFKVFINHRGPDLKIPFAIPLYHLLHSGGLQTFLDKEELEKGELLSPQIEGAIRTASIHITIFSPGYAASTWCLDELLLIWNKYKSCGDTIIPVFYDVMPSELRWITGRYAEALSKHERKGRYDPKTLEKLRVALHDVSNIVGFELKAYNGDKEKLLDAVVKRVLEKGRKIGLDVAMHPTGLEEKVEEFEKTVRLQERQSGKVKIFGIVGMGGSGKTTLAKYFFNKKSSNFGKSCFLFDVRENAARGSLNSLQTQLIKDLAHRDVQINHVDQGKEMLRTKLRTNLGSSQQALVVIDDVDHADQLQAFLPIKDVLPSDSLILVTSRYKDVLTRSGIAESSIYKSTGLNEQYSQQLFCLHAFCQPHPLSGFEDLVHEFCRACDGLPLSLKVFGGLLCENSDKSYWKGLLNDLILRAKLQNDILQTLKLSYDALGVEEKQIFLDIACYFIGENMDMAIRIWDGSGWSGLVGFQNLQAKCLVEVDGENTLKMHDHLRDMGREIADQEKSSGVIPHRLWPLIKDIPDLWQRSSVITEVRGIRTVPRFVKYYGNVQRSIWSKNWCDEVFGNCLRKLNDPRPYCFSNLQLVATKDDHLKSILRRVMSPNLIWLRWNDCPYTCLPSWITMKNTRVLEVSGKKLKTLWRSESQAPLELRELTICSPLLKFPKSIGQLEHIEKIVVKQSHLKSLPEEFCQLRLLKYLELSRSWSLQKLPKSFGYLENLRHLDLSRSWSLRMLPKSFGSLENLRHLDLSESSSLRMLPDTFGNLIHLKHLNLSGCWRLTLSEETFANITTLEYLNLEDCRNVGALPPEVAHQPSLEYLCVSGTGLKELPEDIGNLSNLEYLSVCCRDLKELPEDIGNLSNLETLESGGPLETLPSSLGHLSNLKTLTIDSELKSLSDSLGQLTQLSTLEITRCKIKSLPDSLGLLTQLSFLKIESCPIESLPDSLGLLTQLSFLKIESCPIESLPDSLGLLTQLSTLRISSCEIKSLPDSLGRLTQLSRLQIESCPIESLTAEVVKLNNLVRLTVDGCPLRELPLKKVVEGETALIELSRLEYLYLSLTKVSEISFIEGVCPTLKHLDIRKCDYLVEVGALPPTLTKLYLQDCGQLRKMEGLWNLTNLRDLVIRGCIEVEELPGLERLISLKEFEADGCSKLKRIQGLGQQTELRMLSMSSCFALEEIAGVEDLRSLEELKIASCRKLQWGRGVLKKLRQRGVLVK